MAPPPIWVRLVFVSGTLAVALACLATAFIIIHHVLLLILPISGLILRFRIKSEPPVPAGHVRFYHVAKAKLDGPLRLDAGKGTLGTGFYAWLTRQAAERAAPVWIRSDFLRKPLRLRAVYLIDVPASSLRDLRALVVPHKLHPEFLRLHFMWGLCSVLVMWRKYPIIPNRRYQHYDMLTAPWAFSFDHQVVFRDTPACAALLRGARVTVINRHGERL